MTFKCCIFAENVSQLPSTLLNKISPEWPLRSRGLQCEMLTSPQTTNSQSMHILQISKVEKINQADIKLKWFIISHWQNPLISQCGFFPNFLLMTHGRPHHWLPRCISELKTRIFRSLIFCRNKFIIWVYHARENVNKIFSVFLHSQEVKSATDCIYVHR